MDHVSSGAFFEEKFRLYSGGCEAYEWQKDLFDRFLNGRIEKVIDLPTGTGKTSLMAIWYLSLAWADLKKQPPPLPVRLVWVVNRRVVVDQATDEAVHLQKFAKDQGLTNLNVSTLRGQLADNGDWKARPHEAAIVIGTVDMIGSRLLFMGYGDGPYWRPQHAGLLGVDALFINDEAQLTPAFIKLLLAIQEMNPAAKIPGKQFKVCELTATPISEGSRYPENMGALMASDEAFRDRCRAEKRLILHAEADRAKAEKKIIELSMESIAPRTIIFREKPEDARALVEKLEEKHPGCTALLTGTMRGWERDRLVKDDAIFGLFLKKDASAQPAWLVATSAGEVGINITAERQITMLVEAGPLIQRFGRLNRFGGTPGEAHVVFAPVSDKEPNRRAALQWLQSLPVTEGTYDICAATLRDQKAPSPDKPVTAELYDWLVELWSQTSGPGKARPYPDVWRWLHGKQDYIPQTAVVWRREAAALAEALQRKIVTDEDIEKAFDFFPILPHEKLSEPTSRVREKLAALAVKQPTLRVLLIDRKGSIGFRTLELLSDEKSRLLDESTVVLPPGIGKLVRGMFKEELDRDLTGGGANDVADEEIAGQPRREHWVGLDRETKGQEEERKLKLFDPEAAESDPNVEELYLVYRKQMAPKAAEKSRKPYPLQEHLDQVANKAAEFAKQLVPELETTYKRAGELHDRGKCREVWQNAMGGDPENPVAKPMRRIRPEGLAGYRHELGSLAEYPEEDDLVLHLIAAHHGHARPYFGDKAHDIVKFTESQKQIDAAPERFARLTERYGPWGLAYLEAIFKAADAEVSGQAEGQADA